MPTRWRSRPLVSIPRGCDELVESSFRAAATFTFAAGGRVGDVSRKSSIRSVSGAVAVMLARRGSALYAVSGVSVDSAGTPTGGMDVFLFAAGSMLLIDRGRSDGSGNYTLVSPSNAGNFVVVSFHPDGSLAGVTRPVLEALQVG